LLSFNSNAGVREVETGGGNEREERSLHFDPFVPQGRRDDRLREEAGRI